MSPRVLLVDIGSAAPELPVVTPPEPRPPSSWTPDPRPSPGLAPPTGLAVVSIADAAVLSWTRSTAPGAATVIESAPDNAGVPGVWREVDRTGAESYTLSLPGGPRWVRVRAELNGRTSVATNAVLAEPVPVGDVSEFEQELRDLQERVDTVAAQAAAEAVALNQRADALRTDLDTTIAEVSTLASTTDELGTELTRVESQSIERDTATTATLALLGAKNAAGTAFVLDQSKVQVAPGETLAQWRSSIQGSFQSQSSRIDNEVQARQDADAAHTAAIQAAQSTANNAATKAELTAAQNTFAAANQALGERLDLTQVAIGGMPYAVNPSFEEGLTGWSIPENGGVEEQPGAAFHGKRYLRLRPHGSARAVENDALIEVRPGQRLWITARTMSSGAPEPGVTVRVGWRIYDGDKQPAGYHYPPWKVTGGGTWLYPDGAIGGDVVVPEGWGFVRPRLYVDAFTQGGVIFDAIEVGRESLADAANASLLALTRADVQQNANGLTAATQQIAAANAAIEGKASASDLAATQLTVQQHGQTLSSHGQTLNGLTASVGGVEASVNEVRSVVVEGTGGNRVSNPGFETGDMTGWSYVTGNGRYSVVPNGSTDPNRVLRMNPAADGATAAIINDVRVPYVPGRTYRLGGRARKVSAGTATGTLSYGVRRYRRDGSYHSYHGILNVAANGIPTAFEPHAASFVGADGTDIHYCVLQVTTSGHTEGPLAADDLFLEPLSDAEARAMASYVLAMNAAGKFAGVKYLNDGTVSNAQFLFDNFDFITEDGAFQITGGRTITRSNGFMRVEGKPFGQNNEMVVWYGPEQSNLANCRRNNAISYETNTGLHYAKGAMFAGTITAGGQTLAENATVYTTGPFGTNGGPIVVNASFSHARRQLAGMNAQGKNTISAGSGSTSATLQLWRSIGGAAWQMVASTSITGTFVINSDPAPDVQDQAFWDLVGAINYTDNVGGTATRNYELRVSNIQFRSVSISGPAPVPTPTNSRALGVLTAE